MPSKNTEAHWREKGEHDLETFSFSIKREGEIKILQVHGGRNERRIMREVKRSDTRMLVAKTLEEEDKPVTETPRRWRGSCVWNSQSGPPHYRPGK